MNLSFRPLSRVAAEEVASWEYAGLYATYGTPAVDRPAKVEYLCDLENGFFGAYEGADLIGFCSIGRDGRVSGGVYDETALDVGAGLRPDLVGRGHGASFLRAALAFLGSQGTAFRVTVASWNERALRAARRAGFEHQSTFTDPEGRLFEILVCRSGIRSLPIGERD